MLAVASLPTVCLEELHTPPYYMLYNKSAKYKPIDESSYNNSECSLWQILSGNVDYCNLLIVTEHIFQH